MIERVACRRTINDDAFPGLQRKTIDAVLGQRRHRAPLAAPQDFLAVVVDYLEIDERMRIADIELHDGAFEPDDVALAVGTGERVVRLSRSADRAEDDGNGKQVAELHGPFQLPDVRF